MTRIGSTKQRYRLLADGTVIDQTTGKYVCYLYGVDLEYVWDLPAAAKQAWLKKKIESQNEQS